MTPEGSKLFQKVLNGSKRKKVLKGFVIIKKTQKSFKRF